MFSAARAFAVVLVVDLAFAAAPARGDEPAKPEGRKVIASAAATAYVKPDSARLTFVVSTTEAGDKSAREANEKHLKTLKDALAALDLGKVEVEVNVLPTSVSTLMGTPQNPGGPRPVQGKKAQSVVQVTVRDKDLDKLRKAVGKLAETALENGGVAPDNDSNIGLPRGFRVRRGGGFGPGGPIDDDPEPIAGPSIEWLASSPAEARREAIKRATKDALADAEAAAGGAKLNVVEITVGGSDDTPVRRYSRGDLTTTDAALIPIRVEVRVTCSY
jgi:uncharacterized protein YggE